MQQFAQQVNTRFKNLQGELYIVDINKDDLYQYYLDSFPEGTNNIFRERRAYECSSCSNFIRNLGNVVALDNDGNYITVWDIPEVDTDYHNIVARKMHELILNKPIISVFRSSEKQYGLEKNIELIDNITRTWNHFFGEVSERCYTKNPGESRETSNVKARVLQSGLDLIKDESIDIVLDLIDQNSLERGTEFRHNVIQFKELKKSYIISPKNFAWRNCNINPAVSGIKNTVIGTLLIDIETHDLVDAVNKFAEKVSPLNFKRVKSLYTPKMVEEAMKTIDELGLRPSLNRRHAKISDITINNVIWSDPESRKEMKDSDPLADMLVNNAKKKTYSIKDVEEISINDFIEKVVPNIDKMEVLFENKLKNNLVNIIAPYDNNSPNMFQWNNSLSWSYINEVTDSVKERVKAAGGNVTGDVRVSLSWFNTDDLDLHVYEPNGAYIYFGNKVSAHTKGTLDVDMNVTNPVRDAVENVTWDKLEMMIPGKYLIEVDNYTHRENANYGFNLQVEVKGNVSNFSYNSSVKNSYQALEIEVSSNYEVHITPLKGMTNETAGVEIWNLQTGQYHPCTVLTHSPNCWDNQIGNKHYMFMLKDCLNPDDARGFYNEFLNNDLMVHRKVFDMIGSKSRAAYSDQQLAGLGFSSTLRNEVIVRVSGSFNRLLKIKF